MSKRIAEQMDEPLKKDTTKNSGSEFMLNVKPKISLLEQENFIKNVMDDIQNREENLLYFHADIAFYSHFLHMFTDFSAPFHEIDDVLLFMALKDAVMTSSFAQDLKTYIDKQVSILLKHNDAIDAVSYLANRSLDSVNKVCDILDNVKDLTQDGKFLKVIPKKKLDTIFEWIQKIVEGTVAALK